MTRSDSQVASGWADALTLAVGSLMTLAVSGYQFGRGNHTVYLLEPLRICNPTLFARDWFVTSTLQYHAIFSWLTAGLMKLRIIEPAFLMGYLALIVLWQLAWLRWTQRLGGSRLAYLISITLYYLSAAGISLGVYQFIQDGCFLPSNVASIAMLWGFYFWSIGRRTSAGACLGIAGLFHLSFAAMAVGAWVALFGWDLIVRRSQRQSRREIVIGSLLVLAPSFFNVVNALEIKLRESGSIPIGEFVRIYVRFRHAHHFDPLSWPIALWIAFLWPLPFAAWEWVRQMRAAPQARQLVLIQTARICLLLLMLQVVSFLFAGLFFVSESLVQLMFWRFSMYVKLLACVGTAMLICQAVVVRRALVIVVSSIPMLLVAALILLDGRLHARATDLAARAFQAHRGAVVFFAIISLAPSVAMLWPRELRRNILMAATAGCVLLTLIGWQRCFGWGMTPEVVEPSYLQACHWARDNTPIDAIFLVPPADTVFRLEARRAIIVNFKHVPQLSGEIVEWYRRLEAVIGTNDLTSLPDDYVAKLDAMDARYNGRTPVDLLATAERYHARYVVVARGLGNVRDAREVFRSTDGRYFVYDRGQD